MKPAIKFLLAYLLLLAGVTYGIAATLGPQIKADNERWFATCKSKGGIAYQVPNVSSAWLCVKPHSVIKID